MHVHLFNSSGKKGYEICECGTYHSTELGSKEELYLEGYWGGDRSTMREQIYNLTETNSAPVSKVSTIISHMKGTSVLEVGAAPGILLKKAKEQGWDVYGVEPDKNNIPEIMDISGTTNIACGFYPEVMKGQWLRFDNIVAMDVLEHIEDYKDFINWTKLFLTSGGRFIFMSPIIYEDGLYRERDFIAREHAWIFSKTYLKEYLESIFSKVTFGRWIVGHELVICEK